MTTIAIATEEEEGAARLQQALEGVRADQVVHVSRSSELMAAALEGALSMVLMDIRSFNNTATSMIHLLRHEFRTPVLALADLPNANPNDAFEAGAVDVLSIHSSPMELVARVNAALRRAEQAGLTGVIRTGELEYDIASEELTIAGEPVRLTRTEAEIFRILAENVGMTVSDADLLTAVWGPQYIDAVEYLRVYIGYIRQKIDSRPGKHALASSYIARERGNGYRLRRGPTFRSMTAPWKGRSRQRLVAV